MYDVAEPATAPRIYTPADTAAIAHELDELGQEGVINRRWTEYARILAAAYDTHAEATTAEEIEEWFAKVSFATEFFLVEDYWKKYREVLHGLARQFGLNVENI